MFKGFPYVGCHIGAAQGFPNKVKKTISPIHNEAEVFFCLVKVFFAIEGKQKTLSFMLQARVLPQREETREGYFEGLIPGTVIARKRLCQEELNLPMLFPAREILATFSD
jgi:hypothetical protein